MKLTLKTSKKEFYRKYYQMLNGIFQLTERELTIIVELSYLKSILPTDISSEEQDVILFNTENRDLVSANLNMSKFNLNNYIKILKDKKIIVKNSLNGISIHPKIYVDVNKKENREVAFSFNITD